jgi:hypothetical protein
VIGVLQIVVERIRKIGMKWLRSQMPSYDGDSEIGNKIPLLKDIKKRVKNHPCFLCFSSGLDTNVLKVRVNT